MISLIFPKFCSYFPPFETCFDFRRNAVIFQMFSIFHWKKLENQQLWKFSSPPSISAAALSFACFLSAENPGVALH